MVSIRSSRITHNLSQNGYMAPTGMLLAFQHQNGRALPPSPIHRVLGQKAEALPAANHCAAT